MAVSPSISFVDLRKGMRARVKGVDEMCPDARRLQEMGLTIGAEFDVVKVAPFGDPVEICVRGYRLCLRKQECHCIEIDALD